MGMDQDTRNERLRKLHTIIPKNKMVTGHCLLAAEAELGLVNYMGDGPDGEANAPSAIERLKAECDGAYWRFPGKTTGKEAEEIVRCHAPWHSGYEQPTPREDEVAEPVKRKASRGGKATDTHCAKGHEWTEENTYLDPRQSKVCRTCKREAAQRHKERQLQKQGRS